MSNINDFESLKQQFDPINNEYQELRQEINDMEKEMKKMEEKIMMMKRRRHVVQLERNKIISNIQNLGIIKTDYTKLTVKYYFQKRYIWCDNGNTFGEIKEHVETYTKRYDRDWDKAIIINTHDAYERVYATCKPRRVGGKEELDWDFGDDN